MLITGARVALDSTTAVRKDLWVEGGRVFFSPEGRADTPVLDLNGFLIVPGLINAHDHLELNLFPKLGRGPYLNAIEWAEDIYRPESPPISQHLALSKAIRFRWGVIKNLLSGVTTVAHHNELHPSLFSGDCPIRVVDRFGWAHSIHFAPDWKRRLDRTPEGWPFIIHAAEGLDETAHREIKQLAEAGALRSATVLVHGVAIDQTDIDSLLREGVSLVWSPTSNYFTLGQTMRKSVLDSGVPVALGTDSAMTGDGDLLDELQTAAKTLDANRLYRMVTSDAARILKLSSAFGEIRHNGPADLLVLRDRGQNPAQSLLTSYPQLVIVRGEVELASAVFASTGKLPVVHSFHSFHVEGRGYYFIRQDVRSLAAETKSGLQSHLHLAGKAVAA